MKRFFAFLLAALLCVSCALPAQARTPKVVDYALYTDIVARIDGHAIRSYNIGGYTAVVAEDLRAYGFWVIWNPTERTLCISRAMKDGELETPETWPDYQPGKLTHRIGERAKAVYETDIVTYAAGDMLESFNIDGETLVWIDDLAPFGSVTWHPEEREITLTLGDPMEIALAERAADLEQWRQTAGSGSKYETYLCRTGALLVLYYSGTPHGGMTTMLFVKKNGDKISINNLLPFYIYGSGQYLRPQDIRIDTSGRYLSFLTNVREMTSDWPENGDVKDYGECKCVVDLWDGTLLSMEPLSGGLDWYVSLSGPNETPAGDRLSITVERSGVDTVVMDSVFPGAGLQVSMSSEGVCIIHLARLWEENGYMDTAYYQAFHALRELGLPDTVSDAEFCEATPEQRAEAAKYFSLTINGEPVSGSLWWSRGNNHMDLNFSFDEPLKLLDGDVVHLELGA
jgi:hypothetical protein